MPEYNDPVARDILRQLRDTDRRLQEQIDRLKDAGGVSFNRMPHMDIPNPYEGMAVIGEFGGAYYFENGQWRSFAPYEIKVYGDLESAVVGDGVFKWPIPIGLNGMTLKRAEAGVTTVGSGDLIITLENLDGAGDMLTDPIQIDGGDVTSYTSAAPSSVDAGSAVVQTGDRISINIDDAGGSDSLGLCVILDF